jgi:hypothetical protein
MLGRKKHVDKMTRLSKFKFHALLTIQGKIFIIFAFVKWH